MPHGRVRLGVITEIHIVPPGTQQLAWHNPFLSDRAEELFRAAVDRCVDQQVDAIAILGDSTHFADAESFDVARRVLEAVDLPVYVLPGNHDLDASARPLAMFHRALDLSHVTLAPINRALTPEIDLMLIGLEPGDTERRYAAIRSHAITGNDAKLTLVLSHFPPFAMKEMLAAADLKHAGDVVNRDALLEDLASISGPMAIVNGHLHVHAAIADGRRLQLSVAALTEPPHDVTVLDIGFDAEGAPWIERRAESLVETPDVSLPVLSARHERWQFEHGCWAQRSC